MVEAIVKREEQEQSDQVGIARRMMLKLPARDRQKVEEQLNRLGVSKDE